jgi:hypothetical protein
MMMEIQDLVWDRHNEVVGFNNGPLHALMNKKNIPYADV